MRAPTFSVLRLPEAATPASRSARTNTRSIGLRLVARATTRAEEPERRPSDSPLPRQRRGVARVARVESDAASTASAWLPGDAAAEGPLGPMPEAHVSTYVSTGPLERERAPFYGAQSSTATGIRPSLADRFPQDGGALGLQSGPRVGLLGSADTDVGDDAHEHHPCRKHSIGTRPTVRTRETGLPLRHGPDSPGGGSSQRRPRAITDSLLGRE